MMLKKASEAILQKRYIKLYKEILRYVTGNRHNHVLDTRIRL